MIATATAVAELKPPSSIALTWKAAETGLPLRLASGLHSALRLVLISLLLLVQGLPPIHNDPLLLSTAVTSKFVMVPLLSAPLLAVSS